MALSSEKASELGKKSSRKGVQNKATTQVREAFTNLLQDNLDQLKQDFQELDPKDRIKLFLDMSKYVVPQLKSTELSVDDNTLQALKYTPEERAKRIEELLKIA